ncbi:hypothetical protein COY26_00815 [Candidatus Woesearchaeota archaeon CG_4_10_14_0_2_um_filter_33_10]|nr:MAG: hypothetical protein COV14_02530 [Candidatus Woesearchaeota archaeon CG10_big_fil_rev_8_21_14_0_10_33_12]PIU72627.1 MAG: hypothetical protein COS79_01950 [Candidatus Woesearchaeota archaeon CG06_land_8_20_14_3_00_33_13]PIZ53809.1 MAG: hypothetical protein COY26_00815 [Candidatus Woesearchaeota archaeon CG_4_10_14_0_2_um_filter_33_10]
MRKRIMSIGAHPDDVELGCGGALKRNINNGDLVKVIIMTQGEKGNHIPNFVEAKKSLKLLGVEDILYCDFKDGEIIHKIDTVTTIENYINEFNPSLIYTHSPHDRHQDHTNCSHIVSSAARKVNQILLFESPSTLPTFEPHYFINITETLEYKINALKKYASQVKKGIIDISFVRSQARVWGFKNNVKYAEAFELNHMLY